MLLQQASPDSRCLARTQTYFSLTLCVQQGLLAPLVSFTLEPNWIVHPIVGTLLVVMRERKENHVK